jgi:hypothetical protein
MKKTIFVVSLFVFCSLLIYPQNGTAQPLGSAKILEGNVYILTCFISDQNNVWQYSEKENILRKYNEALNFLKNQALKYNVAINFSKFSFGIDTDIKFSTISARSTGYENTNLISSILKKIGYKNSLSFYNSVIENSNCNNVLVILFAKGHGTGYAMAYESVDMDKELYFVEGVILFEKYLNGMELTSASIAHEVLHLFDAEDLYATFIQTKENEEIAKRNFPNSIMLRVSEKINDLTIDPLTAWLIRWTQTKEPYYDSFRGSSRKK